MVDIIPVCNHTMHTTDFHFKVQDQQS